MRRVLLTSAVVLVLLLFGGAGPAVAEPPLRAGSQVVDRAGVLGGDETTVREAVDRLRRDDGTQLFVVYVRSFDGRGGQDWADASAELSQFGTRDVLLAVAVDDRAYGFWVDREYPVSQSTLDDIVAGDVEPRLAAGDWAGAAVALADGLRTGSAAGGGGPGVGVGVLLGGAALIGGGAYVLSRRRRRAATADGDTHAGAGAPTPTARQAPPDEFTYLATPDLAYRASTALIAVDDAVRSSEQELGLARDRFGDEAVAEFRAALDASRAEMLEAFALRQRLDDDTLEDDPEDERAQRALHAEIIRLCGRADDRLDAQVEAFDRLRELERNVPEVLAALDAPLAAARARLPEVTARLDQLRARYAAAALEPVADNVEQATQRLDATHAEIAEARAALAAADRPEAAVSARAAEEALAQAGTLFDGVAAVETDLAEATARIPDARAEAEKDLAEARAVLAANDPGGLAAVLARAEAGIATADRAAAAPLPDPLAALRLLDEAGVELDRALDAARDAQARAARAAALLDHALLAARSAVAATADFIATRRGAVGREARTRLAEAQRHLELAQSGGDPAAALREAQLADTLAAQALRVARDDVGRWSPPPGMAGRSARIGADLGGLVLGGILSSALRGGGGGFSSGGFGGSATRGRRGGGGGGRRGGGGRF